MAYGIYLSLDQSRWFRNDFSDTDKLTGTIYSDINQVTAKDLTGYTVKFKLFNENRLGARMDVTASIEVAASGTWSYAVTEADMPPGDLYEAKVEISKSGAQESSLNRVQFHVLRGPAD